jgi:hypothetical protein
VGEVVVYYIGLGNPFVNDVQMLHKGVRRRTVFLWEPAPEEEWDSGDGSEEDGGNEEESENDEEGGQDEGKEPANPDGFWGTDRTRRVMREQTSIYLNATLSTSTWQHAYPAIHRELARD